MVFISFKLDKKQTLGDFLLKNMFLSEYMRAWVCAGNQDRPVALDTT